jgi:inorganic triphosphatase YgiF
MSNHTEREFKLRAKQTIETAAIDAVLQELGTTCRLSETVRHTDTYLDDSRATLLREGIGLRIRSKQGKKQLTYKSRKQSEGGLFVRDEVEADWPNDELPQSAADLPEEVRAIIEPLLHQRVLGTQQILSVHREIRILTDGDKDLCELAIDYVVAEANGHCATFQEIELEFCSNEEANQELANKLRDSLPVEFASQDKPSYAAALLGMEVPVEESTEDRALSLISTSIPAHLQALVCDIQTATAAGSPQSAEQLHGLQSLHHSIGSLVNGFAELWPTDTVTRMRSHLHTVHRRIAEVANLNVLVANLELHLAALPTPLKDSGREAGAWIQSTRNAALERLQNWLLSDEHKSGQQQLEQDIAAIAADSELANKQLLHEAPARLASAITRLRAQLHETSIELPIAQVQALLQSAQQVHDTAEQFADLPGKSYKKSLKAVARALRHLEAVCSLDSIAGLLIQWVVRPMDDNEQRALRAAVLGSLATRNSWAEEDTRQVAREAVERLNRDQVWRRFEAPDDANE